MTRLLPPLNSVWTPRTNFCNHELLLSLFYFVFITLWELVCMAPLSETKRALMYPCQQPLPGVPGSWHTHSAQTQSTKSYCCLIGSSSCGNQFQCKFVSLCCFFFFNLCVWGENVTSKWIALSPHSGDVMCLTHSNQSINTIFFAN